jgi:hypothetical protein
MSRRKQVKKKGIHPVVALLLLLGSVGFAVKSLMGSLRDKTAVQLADLIGLGEEDDLMLDEPQVGAGAIVWTDLLRAYGSFDPKEGVRLAFSVMVSSAAVAAAPAGETSLDSGQRWVGEDPPMLRLGVVMVSDQSRRAVLAGSVVGIGDAVAGGEVVAIEPGTLRLRWQQRELTYDLDSEVPREFRAESQRRLLEQQAAGGSNQGDATTELEQGMEEK